MANGPTFAFDLPDPKLVEFQFRCRQSQPDWSAPSTSSSTWPFNSIHLQDVDMNAPVRFDAGCEEGRWWARLRWAKAASFGSDLHRREGGRVKEYFVEQSWELTQQSVAYLKT